MNVFALTVLLNFIIRYFKKHLNPLKELQYFVKLAKKCLKDVLNAIAMDALVQMNVPLINLEQLIKSNVFNSVKLFKKVIFKFF